MSAQPSLSKPDYGQDAPVLVGSFIGGGALLVALAIAFPLIHVGAVTVRTAGMFATPGAIFLVEGLLMVLYAKVGKFRQRERMLARITWRGDEQVLDVGTGRGLLMIGAAKRLSSGHAIGIDIWSQMDLSANRPEAALRNAELEGVRERVEVRNGDASAMEFADASFDVVLSNLCLHNIPSAAGRAQACREIARVLKPGGLALISDFKKTADYAATLRQAGLSVTRSPMYVD